MTKEYRIYHRSTDKYLEFFFSTGSVERFRARQDICFTVAEGESIGFAGLDGSGKSALANIIVGSALAFAINVRYHGHRRSAFRRRSDLHQQMPGKMRKFRKKGRTIVCVSRALPKARAAIGRSGWKGPDGESADVIREHSGFIKYCNAFPAGE